MEGLPGVRDGKGRARVTYIWLCVLVRLGWRWRQFGLGFIYYTIYRRSVLLHHGTLFWWTGREIPSTLGGLDRTSLETEVRSRATLYYKQHL
jgi:hypothetical protein